MTTPFFTIIMACTLSDYKGAATDRERKLVRAIESVIAQTFGDWELLIVADGCERTFDLVREKYVGEKRIDCFLMPQQNNEGVWKRVNDCRNYGHRVAKGKYCLYLDSDDCFGTEHLHKVYVGIGDQCIHKFYKPATENEFNCDTSMPNVVFFDDFIVFNKSDLLPRTKRSCSLQRGKCGTSNIAFKTELKVTWEDQTYLHDWRFIQQLMKFKIKTIQPCEYIVCHIPNPKNPIDV